MFINRVANIPLFCLLQCNVMFFLSIRGGVVVTVGKVFYVPLLTALGISIEFNMIESIESTCGCSVSSNWQPGRPCVTSIQTISPIQTVVKCRLAGKLPNVPPMFV